MSDEWDSLTGVRLPSGMVRGLPAPDRGERRLPAVLRQLSTDGDGAAGLRELRFGRERRAV